MATLKDIARQAGVSTATVSNVINGNHSKVSPANIEKIQALVKELHYVPNQSARALSMRSSRTVAIIIQADAGYNGLSSPYVSQIVGELMLLLQADGYDPLIRFASDFEDINHNLRRWNVAGAIFTGTYDNNIRALSLDLDIPFVFTDSYSLSRRINNVGIDDFKGGVLAGQYLLSKGHRQLAFIAPGMGISELDNQRKEGLCQALRQGGVTQPPAHILNGFYDPGQIVDHLCAMNERPTGLFISSDYLAYQLIGVMAQRGITVPGDFAIVGFDDLEASSLYSPRLTTIAQDVRRKAQTAVDILERHMMNPSLPCENILLDVKLVVRDSAG